MPQHRITGENFDIPVLLDPSLIYQASAEFKAAIKKDEEDPKKRGSRKGRLEDILDLLEEGMRYADDYWDDYMRLINALRAAVRNGDITFARLEDVTDFYFALSDAPQELHEVLNYYVGTGEFMDVFRSMQIMNHLDNQYLRRRSATKILALYSFDMLNDIDEMPLEMRLNLSGFHDTGDKPEEQLASKSDSIQHLNSLNERVRLRRGE